MIRNKNFWDAEKNAPILNRNGNFIKYDNHDESCKRAEEFCKIMSKHINEDIKVEIKKKCNDEEILRIIRLDAERTFSTEENRSLLIEVLQSIYPVINDYHQGLSFVASFLLLFLKPKEVITIITGLHKYYVPGYFKAMPKAYVRDARVFMSILNIFYPHIYKHIEKLITPEAFVSKWFIGLNVHVLTFESLMLFFEHFLKEGTIFLFKYSIALCKNLENEIMKTNDVSRILSLLRLDQKVFPNDYKKSKDDEVGHFFLNIINDACKVDMEKINLNELRQEAIKQMELEEERRKQIEMERALSDDEIVFSDEEEEEEEEEKEEEEEEEEKDDEKKANEEEDGKNCGDDGQSDGDKKKKKNDDTNFDKDKETEKREDDVKSN
ncbi:GTPase-activating protein, putative [Hepatocystis sp. ex Piliocolobus tephrosceles]|nr:GTPase-activating protein, putative [Hepatocystis sp. ex Piliocolobus tephrosceles]